MSGARQFLKEGALVLFAPGTHDAVLLFVLVRLRGIRKFEVEAVHPGDVL